MESEKSLMRANVLDYEPAMALFVKDEDPLIFYRSIARACGFLLAEGGLGIVECNELLANETALQFEKEAGKRPLLVRDLGGKCRFVAF